MDTLQVALPVLEVSNLRAHSRVKLRFPTNLPPAFGEGLAQSGDGIVNKSLQESSPPFKTFILQGPKTINLKASATCLHEYSTARSSLELLELHPPRSTG